MRATGPGLSPSLLKFTVSAGESRQLRLQAKPGVLVKFEAQPGSRLLPAFLHFSIIDSQQRSVTNWNIERGVQDQLHVQRRLEPGNYVVAVRAAGEEWTRQAFQVRGATELTIVLP